LLKEASNNVIDATIGNKALEEFYERFRTVNELPVNELKVQGIRQSSPDKVLRRVSRESLDSDILVPATSAMALVLKYGMGGMPPTVGQLRDKLRQLPQPARQCELK
jgi:hypothetical protein